jgi:hypothetical protein
MKLVAILACTNIGCPMELLKLFFFHELAEQLGISRGHLSEHDGEYRNREIRNDGSGRDQRLSAEPFMLGKVGGPTGDGFSVREDARARCQTLRVSFRLDIGLVAFSLQRTAKEEADCQTRCTDG